MNDLTQSSFDYAALPVDAALTARAAAERIKLRLKRTVEDIIEIGRELKEVKPSLEGRFDAWFEAETGLDRHMSYKFMQVSEKFGVVNNLPSTLSPTVLYLLSAPSTPAEVIDRAVEKAEAGEKVTVADVKDWKAELDAERQARLTAEQRSEEWRQSTKFHKKQAEAFELELIQERQRSAEASERIIEKEVIPDDYDSLKEKSAQLDQVKTELERIKKEQSKIVNEQVKTKLRGYQDEVNELERKKESIEDIVARKQAYLDSLSGEVKRIETHREVINGGRLELIGLAAFLNDMEPMNDHDTVQRWLALADMHQAAAESIRMVFGPAHPKLTVIHGN